MQSINLFYYPNSVDIQLNLDPTLTLRNKVVYQRTLKLYKGIDNTIRFVFKNSDQKPVNLSGPSPSTGFIVVFNVSNPDSGDVLLSKTADIVNAVGGIVTVTLTEFELINCYHEWYSYSVLISDPTTGKNYVVYSDDNYEVEGQIHLISNSYPTLKPSLNVQLPTNSNTTITSSTVTLDHPAAHHTAQYFFTNFSGIVTVQGSLDSLPSNGNTGGNTSLTWGTVSSTTYVNQTATKYENFAGVFTAVRFVIFPLSGSVNKVLYRA
jgi:hypothetical protein